MSRPIFLNADWKNLIMVNYTIDPEILKPLLPLGTVLDTFENRHYVSLVCFNFLNTKLKGIPIPFHVNFEEINLRFYVRGKKRGERGVVFIKEFVPKPALALVANLLYNENYHVAKMSNSVEISERESEFYHSWKTKDSSWNTVSVKALGEPFPPAKDSIEEFIAEHYFGYVIQRDGSSKEYEVKHPSWKVWHNCSLEMRVDFAKLYGENFAFLQDAKPASAFVADGSAITVHEGIILRPAPELSP